MTQRAETLELRTGTCRFCGCTERNPCILLLGVAGAIEIAVQITAEAAAEILEESQDQVTTCAWIDAGRTVCSNPRCVAQLPTEELEALGGAA